MTATLIGAHEAAVSKSELRTVVAASIIGTTVEWYDFFQFGTAAGIIFNKLFFPSHDPLVGTLLAFATFAVGCIARPIGGLISSSPFGDCSPWCEMTCASPAAMR
jgi:hypothetical protein